MPLTDAKARNVKPGPKQIKLFDGDGLYLLVTPAGGKCWRFKYRFGGKEKLLTFGTYPEISLGDARKRREEAREQVAKGIDPSEVRKAEKASKAESAANTFEVVAREWIGKFQSDMVASQYRNRHPAPRKQRLPLDRAAPRCRDFTHRNCWRFCAAWNPGGCWRQRTGSERVAVRSSAMP